MTYLQSIANRLQRSEDQLRLPSELIRQGYDPTFLATYRADEVGLLDRQSLESLQRTLRHADAVEKQRVEIIEQLKADGTFSDELQQLLANTGTAAALDALTRGIRSKKGSRAISVKSPKVLDAVETLLTYDGEAPADVEAWLFEKFNVPGDERNAFAAQVRRMLQCLIAEDVQLLDRMMSQLRRHVVISSEMLPEPTPEQIASEANEQNADAPNTGEGSESVSAGDEKESQDTPAANPDSLPPTGDQPTEPVATSDSVESSIRETQQNSDSASNNETPAEPSETKIESGVQSAVENSSAKDEISEADSTAVGQSTAADPTTVVSSAEKGIGSGEDPESGNQDAGGNDLNVDGFKGKSEHAKLRKGKKEKPVAVTSGSSGKPLSPRQRRRRWLRGVLEGLTKVKRNIGKLSAYQILMLGRGERSRIVEIKYSYDRKQLTRMARETICPKEHPMRDYLSAVASEHTENTILPRLETDLLAESEELAQQALLDSAIGQLDSLLMQRPVEGKTILSIDAIGPKAAAFAVIGKSGEVLHADEIACNSSKPSIVSRNVIALGEIIHKHGVDVIVLSSGPARRYLIHTIKELMAQSADSTLHWTMADRSGVDAYCATRIALRELPEHSKRHRAAIWIGRRIQNPLAELLKIDPARLRLGSYQRELPQDDLKESLNRAFQAARAAQGVDFWNGSLEEFERLPGIDEENANRLIALRTSNDSASREMLREQLLPYLGETNFRQSIGFIRVFDSDQSLDATDIHPDDYKLAERLVATTDLELPSSQPDGWVKSDAGIVAEVNTSEAKTNDTSTAEAEISEPNVGETESNSADQSTAELDATQTGTSPAEEVSEAKTDSNSEGISETQDTAGEAVAEPVTESSGNDSPSEQSEQPTSTESTLPASAETTESQENKPEDSKPDPLTSEDAANTDNETPAETTGTSEIAPEPVEQPSSNEELPAKEANQQEDAPAAKAMAAADQSSNVQEKPVARELHSLQIPAIKMNEVAVDVEKMARGWQVGREKLKNISRSLQNPFADLRHTKPTIPLLSQVPSFENLRPGMSIWAVVIGVADFGVFADLGPDCNGLIHVSRLSPNYVEDPNQIIQSGDLIQVWVLNVDHQKRRIALSAIPPGMETRENDRRGRFEKGRNDRGPNRGRGDRNHSDGARTRSGGNRGGQGGDRDGRGTHQSSGDSRSGDSRGGASDRARNDRGRGKSGKGSFSDSKRDGGRRGGSRRDSRGNRQRRGNDRSRGPITYEAKSKLDPGSEPISEAVKQGKEPMGSFGDLLQVYQSKREQVSDNAAEKRKQGDTPKSVADAKNETAENKTQPADTPNGDAKDQKSDSES